MLLNKRLPTLFVVPMVAAAAFTLVRMANSAADRAVVQSQPPHIWTEQECLQCHTDTRTIKLMRSKRGDPTYCQATYQKLLAQQKGDSAAWTPTK